MMGYLGHFIVYTIAMIGIIYAALLVYKKFSAGCGFGAKSEFLKIEESISLSPRKSLYVIKAGDERFLIAADIDRTALISKLDEQKSSPENVITEIPAVKQARKPSVDDLPTIVHFQKNKNSSVIRRMVSGVKTNEIDIVE